MKSFVLRVLLGASLAALPLAGCASGGGAGGPGRNPNLITAEEMEAAQELNVLSALQRLRPNWVRERGAATIASLSDEVGRYPAVRVDGIPRPGGLEELRSMDTREVVQIRFLSASDATTMYGTGFANGLIEITTRVGVPRG